MRKNRLAVLLAAEAISNCIPETVLFVGSPIEAQAHGGRTDSQGGHRDNKNKSGLGSYHYHCGGYEAHLHPGGVCPYSGGTASANLSNSTGSTTDTAGSETDTSGSVVVPSNISLVFDAAYYGEHNKDISDAVGWDSVQLLENFLSTGMREGRVGIESFQVSVYKDKNPDLAETFGEDLPSYYYHYMNSGYLEGRTAY